MRRYSRALIEPPGTEAKEEESQSLTISFASEEPVDRWFGREILDHSKAGSVNLGRLNNGAALLFNHDPDNHIGVVEKAWVDTVKRKSYATVRFSKNNPDAVQRFKDVKDGILTHVSFAYDLNDESKVSEKSESGVESYRFYGWEPLEVSFVTVAADDGVGFGRGKSIVSNNKTEERKIMVEENTKVAESEFKSELEKVKSDSAARKKCVSEILTIGERHGVGISDVKRFTEGDKSVEDFQNWLLTDFLKAEKVRLKPELGLSRKEIKRYSIARAICKLGQRRFDGLEKEASDEMAKRMKLDCGSNQFIVPGDISSSALGDANDLDSAQREDQMRQIRALSSTVGTAGGFTVQTNVLGDSLIELLRNRTFVLRMGALNLTGLQGNIAIPRQNGGATAYWLTETGTVTAADQSFGQVALIPHRLAATTAYTTQLVAQSAISVEGFIRDDLMRVIAIEKDRVALGGLGAAGEPLGIANTTGIGSVTFGGAATWANIVLFETTLSNANADGGAIGWIVSPAARGKWKSIGKVTNFPTFLWDNDPGMEPGIGIVNGYKAAATNQLTAAVGGVVNRAIYGNWNELIVGDWDGMMITVDPLTLIRAGQYGIVVNTMTDIAIRHAASFVASSDSAAQ